MKQKLLRLMVIVGALVWITQSKPVAGVQGNCDCWGTVTSSHVVMGGICEIDDVGWTANFPDSLSCDTWCVNSIRFVATGKCHEGLCGEFANQPSNWNYTANTAWYGVPYSSRQFSDAAWCS